jgi:hypothetical protein
LCRVVEHHGDHIRLLYDLLDGTSLTQKIVVSLVLPITKILDIEDHKLDNIFLHFACRSQSLLKPTSDQTGSDTNWRTEEGDQRGVNGSQSKFLKETWPMSQNRPDAPLF